MKKLIPLGFGLSPLVYGLVIMKLCVLYSNYIILLLPLGSIVFLLLWYFLGYWSVKLTNKPTSSVLLLNLPLFIFTAAYLLTASLGGDFRFSLVGELLYAANIPLMGLILGIPTSWLAHILIFLPVTAVAWLGCNRACYSKKTGE